MVLERWKKRRERRDEEERERERNEGGTKRVKVRAVSNSRLEGPAWRSGRGPGGPRLARRDRAPKKANHLSSKVALPSGSRVATRGGGGYRVRNKRRAANVCEMTSKNTPGPPITTRAAVAERSPTKRGDRTGRKKEKKRRKYSTGCRVMEKVYFSTNASEELFVSSGFWILISLEKFVVK